MLNSIQEITEALSQGVRPVVQFRAAIEDKECYAEPNMRAQLVALTKTPSDDVLTLTFEFAAFDGHNKAFESANYYDKQGNPTLTARESGAYEPTMLVYVDTTESLPNLFEAVPAQGLRLFEKYLASTKSEPGPPVTYVVWLETELTKALEARRPIICGGG